jgi:hypothetical protein
MYVGSVFAVFAAIAAGIWYITSLSATSPETTNVPPDPLPAVAAVSDSIVVERRDESAAGIPAPNPATEPSHGAAAITASVQRLQGLIDLTDPHPDSVSRAAQVAADLLALTLPDSTRIEVTYRSAEANLILGNEQAACQSLRDVLPDARTTGVFERAILALLERHCAPVGIIRPTL